MRFFSGSVGGLLLLLSYAGLVAAKVDYFARGCQTVVQKSKAFKEVMKMSDDDMSRFICSDFDYARTMADCIVTFSQMPEMAGFAPSQTKGWQVSWDWLDWDCKGDNVGPMKYRLDDVLKANFENPINTSYAEANKMGGSHLFHMNSTLLKPYVAYAVDYHTSRKMGDVLGQTEIIYILGVFAIQIFVNFITWVHPLFYRQIATSGAGRTARWYFSVPPLFDRGIANRIGTYMPRLHVLFLLGLLAIEIICLCADIDASVSPSYATKSIAIANFISVRTGYLSMWKLPLLVLFAGRNNILIWLTGWNMDVFNLWHRWLARIVTLEMIIHAGCYTIEYTGKKLAQKWGQSFWQWGFVSLMCWAIMCVQSMRIVRRISYEVFLLIHFALALVSMIGLYYHLWYTNQCKPLWIACWAIWGFDRIVRFLRLFRNGGLRPARAWSPGRDVIALDVPMPSHWQAGPGAFVFVHFWTPTHFWQSHPFTVVPARAPACDGSKHLKLVFKARTGLTRAILNRIHSSPDETTNVRVLVDGAYGAGLNFAPFDTLLFVAGGIGITAVYSHVRGVSLGHASGSPRRIRVEWLVRDLEPVSCFADELAALGDLGVHVVIHVTGQAQSEDASLLGDAEAQSGSDQGAIDELKDGHPATVRVPLGQGLVEPDMLAAEHDATLAIAVEEKGLPPFTGADGAGRTLRDLTIVYDRPLAEELVLEAALDADKALHIFACGPSPMNNDLREAAAEVLIRAPNKLIQYSEEAFTM